MTKKLEDLLNLPSSKEIVEETKINAASRYGVENTRASNP